MLFRILHNSSLRSKIAMLAVPAVLLAFALFAGWVTQRQEQAFLNRTQIHMRFITGDFVNHHLKKNYELLERNGLQEIESYSNRYQEDAFNILKEQISAIGGVALLVDASGTIKFSSDPEPERFRPVIDRVLVDAASGQQEGQICTQPEDLSLGYLFCDTYFAPWQLNILYLLDRQEVTRELLATRKLYFGGAGIIALLTGLLLFFLINHFVVKRLTFLLGAIERLRKGDYSGRLRLSARDEIGRLAAAFDEMTEQLEKTTSAKDNFNHQLQAANKELESFAYSVSHDLRAPLRAVDGFSQALAEDYGDQLDVDARKYLDYLRQGAQEMGTLIDDLLTLSRSTRGELNLELVDLSLIARAVVDVLQQRNPERTVDVTIEPDLKACCDKRLIKVALENLFGNAWKYTGKTEQAKISLTLTKEDDKTIEIAIGDNGTGFNNDYAGKLFEPFQRLHRKDEFPGSGIGLSTVQRIINRHGGIIRGEGQVGHGAVFYLKLPKERNSHV